jgi:hypothetical protein
VTSGAMSITLELVWGEADAPSDDYTSFEGEEWFQYNLGDAGDLNCQARWELSGTPISPMDSSCENCVFMFDVSYTLDESSSFDDGTCGLDDKMYGIYGYSSSFDGYDGSWVFGYYGTYYWWGYGEFDGVQFTYNYGSIDAPSGDVYYTYYQYGSVTVQ